MFVRIGPLNDDQVFRVMADIPECREEAIGGAMHQIEKEIGPGYDDEVRDTAEHIVDQFFALLRENTPYPEGFKVYAY